MKRAIFRETFLWFNFQILKCISELKDHFPPWKSVGYTRSNQSILKEINPEYSLEGLMLKLKLQYFGHLMWRTNSLEKTLMPGRLRAGEEGGNRGQDGWMSSSTQWTRVWASSRRQWRTREPGVLQSLGSQRVRCYWVLFCQNNNNRGKLRFLKTGWHHMIQQCYRRKDRTNVNWRCCTCLASCKICLI